MKKQFYDKYGKEFHCVTCQDLTTCVNSPEPLLHNCCEQYLRDRIEGLEKQVEKWKEFYKIAIEDFNEVQEENDKTVHLLTEIKEDYDKLFDNYVQTRTDLVKLEREFEQLKKFDELNKTFFDLFRSAFKEPKKLDELFNTLKSIQEKKYQNNPLITFTSDELKKIKELLNTK